MKTPYRFISLILLLTAASTLQAQITIENAFMRIGRYQIVLASDGAQSSIAAPGWTIHPGEGYWEKGFDPLSYGGIDQPVCKNWTDPDGRFWNYMIVSPTQQGSSIKFPLKLNDGKYMHNYVRYPQTLVTVNGKVTSDPSPRGEVNPAAIDAMGITADQYVESTSLTNVGLEFRRRAYAWAHYQDNNYIVCEYIIKNVGVGWGPNQQVKLDLSTFRFMIDTVRLPVQTIQGFIFGLERERPVTYIAMKRLQEKGWFSSIGFRKTDSLRMMYVYDGQVLGVAYPSVGEPLAAQQGRLQNYMAHFVQTLHADKAWNDKSDDIEQPRYTSYAQNWNDAKPGLWGDFATETLYKWLVDSTMSGGPFYQGPDVYPGLHQVNMDDRGYSIPALVPNYNPYYCHSHCGPYDIPPGQSIRIVFAMGVAGLPPEFAFQVGRDWQKGICTFNGKNTSPAPRPPNETDNDWAKDQWVYSSVDTMFKTGSRAKWNAEHGFQIPKPPPPLTWLNIQEQVGGVKLTWSNNAEPDPRLEGYRIYRATGASDTTIYRLVAELSKSRGNLRTEYLDQDLDRGPDYYYYVNTFGYSTGPNAYKKGEVLESGINYVEAFAPTRFVPKQGLPTGHWQDSVRVVPNPFNLSAKDVQFSTTPDKIMFVNLPPVCSIKIYSENGNLIKTIQHSDGKSDEQWETGGQYMLTDGGQRIVSGIYIAYFETPAGEHQFRKFAVVR